MLSFVYITGKAEMLETGIDIKMVRKYLGDDVADHMKVFCIEHGLI